MTLTKDFTQKLYDDFASNAKYRAVENAVTKKMVYSMLWKLAVHMQQICQNFQLIWQKIQLPIKSNLVVVGCLQHWILSVIKRSLTSKWRILNFLKRTLSSGISMKNQIGSSNNCWKIPIWIANVYVSCSKHLKVMADSGTWL